MENGAKRVLIPIENRRQFLEVSGDVAERMDPIFNSDAPVAANKAFLLARKGRVDDAIFGTGFIQTPELAGFRSIVSTVLFLTFFEPRPYCPA